MFVSLRSLFGGERRPGSSRSLVSIPICLLLVYLVLGSSESLAEELDDRPSIDIGWTKNPPQIDGQLSPDEWADAAHVPSLTQAMPDPGEAATQRSEIWIMTDEDHLYIAARLWDTNPEEIVAFAMARDQDLRNDDRFGFTIDTFLDRQNGYFFQVNPNGARRDFLFEAGGFEPSWDGRWYAKTSVDEHGWIVEIALPYATINFNPDLDVWGFNMARGIRRRSEIDRWADPVLERFLTAMGQAGNLVGMKGVQQGLGLQVVPAATLERVDDTNQFADQDERHKTNFEPSVDVFYKVTPSLTTSLTVNTDFGESEVDQRQVNLSQFALFFPEKRDFFLQDGLIFNFANLQRNGRPFFSRKIGLDEDGEPQDIIAGGKITGRVGRFKVGILNVVLDEHHQVDQQNVLVARAAANFGESTLGGVLTYGDPSGMGDNLVVGLDYNYRNTDFLGGQNLNGNIWIQNSTSDPDTGPNVDPEAINGNGLAYGAQIEFPNDEYNWKLTARILEDEFYPALGFVNRIGIREYRGELRRRWRPLSGPLQNVDTKIEGRLVTGFSPNVESAHFVWTAVDLVSPIGDEIRFQYAHRYEAVDTAFDNISVPIGRFHFDEGRLRIKASKNRWIGGEFFFGVGSFFDGTRTRARTEVSFRFSKFVQTSVIYSIDDIRLPDGDDLIHLLTARLSFFFTPQISWVTLAQFDNVSDTVGINSRFRWIIEDGRELFLVLNQGLDTSDGVQATRTAPLVKLQWTFRF